MTAGAQAQPRWTFSLFMIVLATSIPFVVEAVDPTLLSLNMPTIQRDLGIPSDLVGFTGSIATLVMAAAVLGAGNLGDLYGHKRLLMYGALNRHHKPPLPVTKRQNSPAPHRRSSKGRFL